MLPALVQVHAERLGFDDYPYNTSLHPWLNARSLDPVEVHSSTTVTDLLLAIDWSPRTTVCLWEIYPNLRKLDTTNMSSGPSRPFASLWLWLLQLESVHLKDKIVLTTENLDAEFVGIHDEEVEFLRQEDDETLEKIHIVPIRPSVLTITRKPSKTCAFRPLK